MFVIADQRNRTLHAGAEMRPRRWYTDEHAPPARTTRMTSQLWRYRTLAQRRTNDAAPMLERRCYCPQLSTYVMSSDSGRLKYESFLQALDRRAGVPDRCALTNSQRVRA